MSFRFGLESITFNEGTTIDVPDQGILVLVGPNNAGKSVALREIVTRLTQRTALVPTRVVTNVDAARDGTESELNDWLCEHAFRRVQQGSVFFKRPSIDAPGTGYALSGARMTLSIRF